jgi:hypothetical protein
LFYEKSEKNINIIYKMARTRHTRKTHNSTKRAEKCCKATFHAINHWYKEEFEKLGWMVLANHRGMDDKIMHYKKSLDRLHLRTFQVRGNSYLCH